MSELVKRIGRQVSWVAGAPLRWVGYHLGLGAEAAVGLIRTLRVCRDEMKPEDAKNQLDDELSAVRRLYGL